MMKTKRWFVILISLIIGITVCNAQKNADDVMEGSIGKYPIVMQLTRHSNGTVTGWYYYKSKGPKNKIMLSGNYSNYEFDGWDIRLTEKVNGKITGIFNGKYNAHPYSGIMVYDFLGTWHSPDGDRSYDVWTSNLQ